MKPLKIFYGWWIVIASFFISLYVGGAVFFGFTAIFEPIASEMGWSYTQVSLAASLRGLEAGLLAPLIGIIVDRWGPRRLIFGGALFAFSGLILLSQTMSLAMFYGAFALIAVGTSCLTLTVLMTAITNWFQRKVGVASGIAVSGFGFGGLLVPLIVKLVDIYDWRMTMVFFALGIIVIVLPLSILFRHKPEQYGYLPDGRAGDLLIYDDALGISPAIKVDIGLKRVLRSSTFWRLGLAYACHMMLVATVATHVMPYLSSIGIPRARSSLVATIIPLMSIGGRLGFGWFGDRYSRKRVAAAAFAMMALGLLCFEYTSMVSPWLLAPFLVFFGVGWGGSVTMRLVLVREYFGRANFGTFFGFVIGVAMLGNMAGPPITGWVYDNWGSYQGIWFVFAGLAAAVLALLLTISPVSNERKPAV